ARAEAHGHEAGVEECRFLLRIESRLWPSGDGEVFAAAFERLREAQLRRWRQQNLDASTPSVVTCGDHWMHRRDPIATALLASGDRDLLPVRMASGGTLALRSRDGRGGKHRLDLGDAEFDALAHRQLHALVGRDA